MKYQVGDVVFVKIIHPRIHLSQKRKRLIQRGLPCLHIHPAFNVQNTFGIIAKIEKHSDIFGMDSTENDNGYIWYSQVDAKEYYFYEDDVTGELIS